MTNGRVVHAYTQTQVSTTTSQKQLIVMAYDGMVRFLRAAKVHLANGEIESKYETLFKARAIMEELASTLNMAEGGEVAKNLWTLYVHFMRKISEANLANDPSLIDEILPAIQTLRDAWAAAEIPEEDVQVRALDRRVPAIEVAHRVSITG